MNKRTILYLVVIIVLAGVAYWLLQDKNDTSTLQDLENEYTFGIEDTASVDRIEISDKTPSAVTLVRGENGWLVDGKYPARGEAVEDLLDALHRMELRNFIPKRMQETVIRRMSVYGKDVKVYQDGKLTRHFVVGTDAQDEMGTYMMNVGAEAPYAVHIPGFNGFLSIRFFTEPYLWKKRIITEIDPRAITRVSIRYPDSVNSSFSVTADNMNDIQFSDANGIINAAVDIDKVRNFILAAGRMRYEGAIIPSDPIYARRDSLLASTPVFEMEVEDSDGNVTNLQGYKIIGPEESFDPDLDAPEYDPDRMHGFINEEDMVLIQYYGLRRVLKPASYFTKP